MFLVGRVQRVLTYRQILSIRTTSTCSSICKRLNMSEPDGTLQHQPQTQDLPLRSDTAPVAHPSQAKPREDAYGFVVYRTDYTSDAKWVSFMSFLNAQARSTLISSNCSDLLDQLDWNVQEAPELEDADYDQVRK